MEDLVADLARAYSLVTALTVSSAATVFVFLAGKQHGETARFRRFVFRCVASEVRYPSMGFRVGLAFVAIGFAFVAYFRMVGQTTPDPIRMIVSGGMFLTVISTCGRALYRGVTQFPSQRILAKVKGA